jgi:hypothetical protein
MIRILPAGFDRAERLAAATMSHKRSGHAKNCMLGRNPFDGKLFSEFHGQHWIRAQLKSALKSMTFCNQADAASRNTSGRSLRQC